MHKDLAPCEQEDLGREHETISSVNERVFHNAEDDLNFSFREFLLLSGVNNVESVSAVALANSGANALLIISVRCNDNCSLSKADRQLFEVIQTY
jgi:hypothetical protein